MAKKKAKKNAFIGVYCTDAQKRELMRKHRNSSKQADYQAAGKVYSFSRFLVETVLGL